MQEILGGQVTNLPSQHFLPALMIESQPQKKDWILSHERNPVCVNDMFLPMNVYAKS